MLLRQNNKMSTDLTLLNKIVVLLDSMSHQEEINYPNTIVLVDVKSPVHAVTLKPGACFLWIPEAPKVLVCSKNTFRNNHTGINNSMKKQTILCCIGSSNICKTNRYRARYKCNRKHKILLKAEHELKTLCRSKYFNRTVD